jgi:hypothetical protein
MSLALPRKEIVCRSFIDIYIYNKGDKLPVKCIESNMADTNFFFALIAKFLKVHSRLESPSHPE